MGFLSGERTGVQGGKGRVAKEVEMFEAGAGEFPRRGEDFSQGQGAELVSFAHESRGFGQVRESLALEVRHAFRESARGGVLAGGQGFGAVALHLESQAESFAPGRGGLDETGAAGPVGQGPGQSAEDQQGVLFVTDAEVHDLAGSSSRSREFEFGAGSFLARQQAAQERMRRLDELELVEGGGESGQVAGDAQPGGRRQAKGGAEPTEDALAMRFAAGEHGRASAASREREALIETSGLTEFPAGLRRRAEPVREHEVSAGRLDP